MPEREREEERERERERVVCVEYYYHGEEVDDQVSLQSSLLKPSEALGLCMFKTHSLSHNYSKSGVSTNGALSVHPLHITHIKIFHEIKVLMCTIHFSGCRRSVQS